MTAERAKGKKLCQDLAVTAPFDNKYPHAILKQEKSLITSLRSYLTKLHYGSICMTQQKRFRGATNVTT